MAVYKVFKHGNFLEVIDEDNNQVWNVNVRNARVFRHDMSQTWYDFYNKDDRFLTKIFLSSIHDENGDPYTFTDFEEFRRCSFGHTIIGETCEGLGLAGLNGADGASAYEVAVTDGFVGTVTEWLASLEGADGTNGEPGIDGNNGNYTVQTAEAPGANCPNGGVKLDLYDGITNSLISSNYVCNAVNTSNVKRYKGKIQQTGTNAPSIYWLENPGPTLFVSRYASGWFKLTSSGLFPNANNVFAYINNTQPSPGGSVYPAVISVDDANTLSIRASDGTLTPGSNILIEIYS